MIVKAMLEHESLPGVSDVPKPGGVRSSAFAANDANKNGGGGNSGERCTIETLLKKLTEFLNLLNSHGVDPEIVNQIFKQASKNKKQKQKTLFILFKFLIFSFFFLF